MNRPPSKEPGKRNVVRWLAYYKPLVVEVETDTGERQRVIVDQKSAKRWDACYSTMLSLNACVARALDSKDSVLATYALRERPELVADDRPAVEVPATSQGTDVAAIMQTFSDALVRGIERVADRIVEAQKTAFQELTNIAKASNERALISERERMRALDDREERLEEEEQRREEERERLEAERERDREENASLREVMGPVIAAAAPQLVESFLAKKPQAVEVEAKPVTTNGAPK